MSTQLVRIVVVAAAATTILTTNTGPAWAGDTSPLRVRPHAGSDSEPLTLVTAAGCPLPATNIVATIHGRGFRAGQNIVGNQSAGVLAFGPFEVSPAYTFASLTQLMARPVPLHGTYRIVVACRTAAGAGHYRTFAARVRFTNPHHWVAQRVRRGVATRHQVVAARALAAQSAGPSSSGPDVQRPGPGTADPQQPAPAAVHRPDGDTATTSTALVVIGSLVAMAVLLAAALARRGRTTVPST